MPVGTTQGLTISRNEIIASALRKLKQYPEDGIISLALIDAAILALNQIVNQEDLIGQANRINQWARAETAVLLTANTYRYPVGTGGIGDIPGDIADLEAASYRDANGEDWPLRIVTSSQWADLTEKKRSGAVELIYLSRNRALGGQELWVWPVPSSLTTASVVLGTDNANYTCVLKHTAAAVNRPITGQDWKLYWKKAGSGGATWSSGAAYVNQELVYLVYKRPLFNFDSSVNDPDFPAGWGLYLTYRLALELAPELGISLDDRNWLAAQVSFHRKAIFSSEQPDTRGNLYNKAVFF